MIFFDIDETLVDNGGAERAAAREFHALHRDVFLSSPDEFVALWQAATRKHAPRYLSGELSFQGQRRERIRDMFSTIRPLSDREADALFAVYLESYERSWRLFPDVLPCLDRLSRSPLGIISNGESYQQRRKLSALGLVDRFSIVVISEEAGCSKPDARIFHEACRRAGQQPAACWHIGDDPRADAQGSCAAGLRGIWLNRASGACNPTDPEAMERIAVVRSLSELEELIA